MGDLTALEGGRPKRKPVQPSRQAGVARVGKLKSSEDVSRELARLYRMALRREVEAADAQRLGSLLTSLAGMLGDQEVDRKLARLEAQLIKAGYQFDDDDDQ